LFTSFLFSSRIGRPLRIPDFKTLEVSEGTASALVRPFADAFNKSASVLHKTIHGKDLQTFAKVRETTGISNGNVLRATLPFIEACFEWSDKDVQKFCQGKGVSGGTELDMTLRASTPILKVPVQPLAKIRPMMEALSRK
jgi:hypothetical protein